MCLLSLFFGLAAGVLLLGVGLGDGVQGGDLGVLDLLLGDDVEGGTSLMLTIESLLEKE